MSVLLSMISTLMGSLSNIYRKKSLSMWANLSSLTFYFIGQWGGIVLSLLLILFNQFEFSLFNQYLLIWLILINIWFSLANMSSTQNIYRNEKMSVLLPYEQLNKIISILIAFIFFKEATLWSFIIAILTVLIIMWFSYDFKNHAIPKNLKWMLIIQTNVAIRALIIAYTLKHTTSINLFVAVGIISPIIVLTLLIFLRKLKELKWVDTNFYKARLIPSFMWWITSLISFYLLTKLGLIYTNLLSFLGMLFTIILSYLVFGDKPSRKDLLLSLIITVMVWIWFYFK